MELGICLISPDVLLKFSPAFQNLEAVSRGVLQKLYSGKWCDEIYSSPVPIVKRRKGLHAYLLKIELHHRHTSKNLTKSSEQRNWKMHLDEYFKGELLFENIPEWLLLKSNCKDIFISKVLMVTHIFTATSY